VNTVRSPSLGVAETSVLARHTFKGTTFGLSLNATQRQFDSNRYQLTDADDLRDVAVTFHYGDAGFNSRLTAGYLADTAVDRMYFQGGVSGQFGEGKHGYDVELAANEAPTASALLQLRGKQNRASATVDLSLGRMGFARINAKAVDISTRISEQLNNFVGLSEIIGERSSTLSIGASLSRGGIAQNYPQVNSPRYFMNVRAGHTWPQKNFGLQFEAGAGMRIIGGDELSIGVSHNGLASSLLDRGRSRFGMNYRYHF